ncbi:MAG: phosphatidylserine/phosphatidylglycerophosphate/cardiolipin synthase-like enzyme, partial [Halioglobus sp.]
SDANHLVTLLDKRLDALVKGGANLSLTEGLVSAGTETIQIVSESSIHKAVLAAIDGARAGDSIEMAMFYLSERKIIAALKKAATDGVEVRVLLDVNSDAFGRSKNGVPNRPVAAELVKASVAVRWCLTKGEQCHAKWLHVRNSERHKFFIGSANFTGRNLLDLNMETDVRLVLNSDNSMTQEMIDFFESQWSNAGGRGYSASYDEFADDNVWLTLQYRFMEMTGLSTF